MRKRKSDKASLRSSLRLPFARAHNATGNYIIYLTRNGVCVRWELQHSGGGGYWILNIGGARRKTRRWRRRRRAHARSISFALWFTRSLSTSVYECSSHLQKTFLCENRHQGRVGLKSGVLCWPSSTEERKTWPQSPFDASDRQCVWWHLFALCQDYKTVMARVKEKLYPIKLYKSDQKRQILIQIFLGRENIMSCCVR